MNKTQSSMVTPTGIAVALAVVIALGFLFLGPGLFSPLASTGEENTLETAMLPETTNDGTLMITDTVVGTGVEVRSGMKVTVNYVGKLENGTVFDASANHGGPFTFTVDGNPPVIQGWNQGVVGMKVGGTRHLVIPPELGYGDQAIGSIPANSTLHFDVEVVAAE